MKKNKKMPQVSILPITDLKGDDKNFNKGTNHGRKLLLTSLERFGAFRSIALDKNNVVLAGNKTKEAFEITGGKNVVIVDAGENTLIAVRNKHLDINTPEGREAALADNAVALADISINEALVEEVLSVEVAQAWLADDDNTASRQDDYEPSTPGTIKTDIKPGDLFQIGKHRLLCGDSTNNNDVNRLMNGELSDMVFIDPPYAVKYGKDQDELQRKSGGKFSKQRKFSKIEGDELSAKACAEKIWKPAFKNLYEYAQDHCSIYMTMCQGGDQMMMMMMMAAQNWQIKHELIWVKNAPVFSMGRLDYDYKHEPILFGWKKKHYFYGKGPFKNSVWEIPKPTKSTEHPTMKPIALISNAILNSSKEGDLIVDLFVGSGTTIIAAEDNKRKCYAMEYAPEYCQVIIDRIKATFPKLPIKKLK